MTSDERKLIRYQRRQEKRNKQKTQLTFEEVFSYENLFKSALKCLKGVSWKTSVQNLIIGLPTYLASIHKQLITNTYKSHPYEIFTIHERGKKRECQSIHIRDRVIQKCLCDYVLLPILVPKLIINNFACLKNRGINFARQTFKKALREIGSDGYILNIDFKSYFDSIDHVILMQKLQQVITDKKILNLIQQLLNLYDKNELHKGLALGSQMSQSFALFYLNDLDHYIVDTLHIKHYGRYMDDIYILAKDKQELLTILNLIQQFIQKDKVSINLKKTHINKLSRGAYFLKRKYIFQGNKLIELPNKNTFKSIRKKIKGVNSINNLITLFRSWYGNNRKLACHHQLKNIRSLYKQKLESLYQTQKELEINEKCYHFGASRVVLMLDNYVVKYGYNQKGIEDNQKEYEYYRQNPKFYAWCFLTRDCDLIMERLSDYSEEIRNVVGGHPYICNKYKNDYIGSITCDHLCFQCKEAAQIAIPKNFKEFLKCKPHDHIQCGFDFYGRLKYYDFADAKQKNKVTNSVTDITAIVDFILKLPKRRRFSNSKILKILSNNKKYRYKKTK